jgi:hypothetical protein
LPDQRFRLFQVSRLGMPGDMRWRLVIQRFGGGKKNEHRILLNEGQKAIVASKWKTSFPKAAKPVASAVDNFYTTSFNTNKNNNFYIEIINLQNRSDNCFQPNAISHQYQGELQ